MKPIRLSDIARMANGRLRGDDRVVTALVTDTRALGDAGSALFVALKGERFDGHDHVAAAAQGGVAAALVARELDVALPQVIVADTERALADIAAMLQRERTTQVVAITGSNGKTSVKALLLAILERECATAGGAVYANPGNRNNEIGLPLAVIDAPDDARFAIYEMGAGKPGDIAYLTAIARPQVALVNNIAPAHLERMGSLLGVADTKAAVYDALPADGVAVINDDDAFAPYFAERAHGRRILRFGLDGNPEIGASAIVAGADGSRFTLHTPIGDVAIALAMPGRHNVRNALAAASLALGLGASLDTIAAGLEAAQQVAGRLVAHTLDSGAVLVDDSYNANPGSLAAAIDTLAEASRSERAEGWLVLGDMRELGEDAEAMHAEAGRRAKAAGIARLFALGPLSAAAAQSFGDGATHYDTHAALAAALAQDARAGVRVLVKGSRGSAMDRIVTALLSGGTQSQGKGNHHAA
ncbi:UDP-N-acetylmuramoyl-tripeptide--D-alanyl-D-alanine ligase [Montanilutibacter psychrotolerans]|uniref:UDP-N-acetylmuramoyl-tripeptide--D-alanyl-D-alanine ligase n=1 Tax=Montanilutibacter psychrotolerans TaxID=1327343 RepID=A0A3M8SSL1_9GAMM|nr:UDP-N-acetylmuramoyl-tripeptide--D-alanyl-D-alanine ligase [Lysobacter psychrotolerans]RNF84289.1 UDP-N-acetylmuramoyl-tripeptide--D-alanyl-D-alanine ligase [Lysobacter psychrotolerans]